MTDRKNFHDVIIIGGGIVGIGLFRDLSLHQIDCLLIEKNDFSSQTSQSSSKMLHGGIRYLEQGDFLLVKEALAEKNLWLKLAPHLCLELPFYLPIYKESKYPKWMTRIGLFLYDFLSGFGNSPHKMCNSAETLKQIPNLKTQGLKGAGVYFDGIVDDSKLGLECLYDGLIEQKNSALNYTEVTEFSYHQNYSQIKIKNRFSGEEKILKCRELIFAVGPFTDQLLQKFKIYNNGHNLLLPSKGSHLWIKKEALPLNHPMVLQTKDGRVIFVIPQKNAVLVGTTEIKVKGNEEFFNLKISVSETQYLLSSLNEYFPQLNIRPEHILSSFAGIRPLVKEDSNSENTYNVGREHKIFNPFHNVHIIAGGKYTTFRLMGQSICQTIITRMGKTYNPNLTKQPLRQKSVVLPFAPHDFSQLTTQDIEKILTREGPKTFEDLVVRRLGIPTRAHWNGTHSFDDFFIPLIPLLKKYLENNFDKNIILNFP